MESDSCFPAIVGHDNSKTAREGICQRLVQQPCEFKSFGQVLDMEMIDEAFESGLIFSSAGKRGTARL